MRPPVPQRHPVMGQNGLVTMPWLRYFDDVWNATDEATVLQTFQLIPPTQAPSTAAVFYIARNGPVQVTKATAVNNDTVAHTLSIYFVPTGQTPAVSNILFSASVPASTTLELTQIENHALPQYTQIAMVADAAAKVTVTVSGVQLR